MAGADDLSQADSENEEEMEDNDIDRSDSENEDGFDDDADDDGNSFGSYGEYGDEDEGSDGAGGEEGERSDVMSFSQDPYYEEDDEDTGGYDEERGFRRVRDMPRLPPPISDDGANTILWPDVTVQLNPSGHITQELHDIEQHIRRMAESRLAADPQNQERSRSRSFSSNSNS